uniref:ShKT domain-containing protein n=1 Tax=Ditylenchus dipsaci TaxID=166011 RepID=A0A915EG12_9BILA
MIGRIQTVSRLVTSPITNTSSVRSAVTTCVDRVNNCQHLNNLCTIPRFSIQMLRSCRSTCRFCDITNIPQLAAELRLRNIILGH